jgi:hypothetical protein
MNLKSLNQKIDEFIIQNPKKHKEEGYYTKIASIFNIHPEKARKRWRMINEKKRNPSENSLIAINTDNCKDYSSYTWSNDGSGTFSATTSEKIENLEDLKRIAKIDTEKYDIVNYEVKSYNAWIKNEDNKIETKQLYSVKASLKLKKVDNNILLQKELLLNEIKKHSPKSQKLTNKPIDGRDTALEINIPDLHIGKLAWGRETGEDYDIGIAVERYKKAMYELISRVNTDTLERFILPIGNDMINVDNKGNTTTAGTNVSCDSRFGKMFQTAKELLIDTIEVLSVIAPVDVIVIPGNHDSVSMFTLGEVIDAWFHNNPNVSIVNTHTPRKYYKYGTNLIMYTHGHNEKLNDLGIICATEQPKLWAETKFRRVHVGHFHHSKQIKFTDVQEYPGFTVKILNSLSSNDAWHAEKGYLSLKAAEAFLYHKDKGLLANYYYMN